MVPKDAKVTWWLADYAQLSPDGKLHSVGAGIAVIGPTPTPYFIAVLIEMPWNAAGIRHEVKLELIDDDGNGVIPEGESEPVVVRGQFDLAPAPGLKRGTPLVMPAALGIQPMALAPGSRFEWRLELNGVTHEDWRLGFSTRPDAQSAAA